MKDSTSEMRTTLWSERPAEESAESAHSRIPCLLVFRRIKSWAFRLWARAIRVLIAGAPASAAKIWRLIVKTDPSNTKSESRLSLPQSTSFYSKLYFRTKVSRSLNSQKIGTMGFYSRSQNLKNQLHQCWEDSQKSLKGFCTWIGQLQDGGRRRTLPN